MDLANKLYGGAQPAGDRTSAAGLIDQGKPIPKRKKKPASQVMYPQQGTGAGP